MGSDDFDWDSLSEREGTFTEQAARELQAVEWAAPMLAALERAGGIKHGNKSLLFELRFSFALAECGIAPRYEIEGEGNSTIDFGFSSRGQPWAVELMRLNETSSALAATRTATDEDGVVWSRRLLSSLAEDKRQSPDGETLKAVERICQKCERNGRPHKFPRPNGALHAILVDLRTLLHGGDKADRLQIALGWRAVPSELRAAWESKPITGVFDPATQLRGAAEARERIHFIGFVNEKEFAPGSFGKAIQFVANPDLFTDEAEARAAISTWPLQPADVLNIRKA